MQPRSSDAGPGPAELQQDGDDAPEPADSTRPPPHSHNKVPPPAAPKLKASNSLKRIFRAGSSSPAVHDESTAALAMTNGPRPPPAIIDRTSREKTPTQTTVLSNGASKAMSTSSSGGSPSPSISPSSTIPPPPSSATSASNPGSLNSPSSPSTPTARGGSSTPTPQPAPMTSPPASRPSSRKSSFSSEQKAGAVASRFTLKDLLANGPPKLVRRASQSSRKSDASSDYIPDHHTAHTGGTAPSFNHALVAPGGGSRPPSRAGSATSGTSLLKKYGVCEKIAIGKGATSVVRLAHKWDRSEEKLYAVKEFRKRRKNESEKEYTKKLTAEFCISSTLHHRNIVETVDLVQDEAHHWCEVMEYCPGGDLYAAIKKGGMSMSEIECCFRQLCEGVSYLHEQGVAHRDIKPENLFFDTKGCLKIGDYGASTVYRLPWEATIHMSTGLCGSEPYIAPEQFLRKPYDARLVDIWAIGIVYYCLLFQELPWRVAQTSDPLFLAYQQACAAKPFRKDDDEGMSGKKGTLKPRRGSDIHAGEKPASAMTATTNNTTNATNASAFVSVPSASTASASSHTPSSTTSTNTTTHSHSTLHPPTASRQSTTSSTYSSSTSSSSASTISFPPTITNIEPRSARPLLRRILEPDPKHRATITDIMAHVWIKEIEVCTLVEHPKHGHASIRAALGQGVSVVGQDD